MPGDSRGAISRLPFPAIASHITFPVAVISSIVAILSAIAGIAVLWRPLATFSTTYLYSQAPSLYYAYDNSTTTALCDPVDKEFGYYEWWCWPQSLASVPSYTDNVENVLFTIQSFIDQNSYTVLTNYFQTYTKPASVASVTSSSSSANLSSGIPTVTSASPSLTPTVISVTQSIILDSTFPALLKGSIVATATSAPILKVIEVTPAHTTNDFRAYLLFYQIFSIFVILVSLMFAGSSTFIAWRRLRRNGPAVEVQSIIEQKSHEKPINQVESALVTDTMYNDHNTQKGSSGLLDAWNSLPEDSVSYLWIYNIVPIILFGLVALIIQGTGMTGLTSFVHAGACGSNSTDVSKWADVMCSDYAADFPGTFAPYGSNKPVEMSSYAWPSIVTLALLAVLFSSMTTFCVVMWGKVKMERKKAITNQK